MGYAEARTWLPVAPEGVFDHLSDPATWPAWLPLAEARADRSGRLAEVGASARGRVLGRRDRPVVTWEVTGRRRLNVHLDARDGTAVLAQLHLSASPWNGGCAVEVRYDAVPTARDLPLLGSRLRRGIATLSRAFDDTAVAGAGSALPNAPSALRPARPRAGSGVSGPRPV